MQVKPSFCALGLRSIVFLAVVAAASPALPAFASSHKEAPYITELSKVDGTDFYMFNSYEAGRGEFVTILACYVPFQVPYGGPNFTQLDPEARYEIKIDNNGDARPDLTFRFKFTQTLRDLRLNIGGTMVSVPLINTGPISANDNSHLNVIENYTLDVIYGDPDEATPQHVINLSQAGIVFTKPVDNIGVKSIADYEAYARSFIADIMVPGSEIPGRVFVGQRKDPFVVNLGEVFDLINLNPVGPPDAKSNILDDDNVTVMALELPKSLLTHGDPIIGGWTTASLPKNRMLKNFPTYAAPDKQVGDFIQVSRLGMPLVNEVVIGLKDKNKFNNSEPINDAQFLTYVTNPTSPALIQALFNVQAPCLPRNDLVAVFLTGLEGLNKPANVRPAEMLRLNTSIAAKPKGQQNYLGALGADNAGFPNGRRPGDDVIDIELRAVVGALISDANCAPGHNLPITDGALCTDALFDAVFPYAVKPVVASPNQSPPAVTGNH